MGIISKNLDELDRALRNKAVDPYLTKMEETVKLPRKYLGLALVLMSVIGLFVGFINHIVSTIGFLYPAYKSIKAIESKSTRDDQRWLIYWVVYSSFILVEYFSDILLSWFPMYYFGKAALLVWCMLYNGSEVIYYNFIKPLFLKHEKEIDNLVETAQTKGAGTLNKIVGEVGEIGEEVLQSTAVKDKMTEGLRKATEIALSSTNVLEPTGDGQVNEGDKKDD